MLDDYSPPSRRSAPPAMKNRIRSELLASGGRSRLRVIVPVAAAVALVAGVAGGVAAQQLPLHHDIVVVPAGSPTTRPSGHPKSSPKTAGKVPRPMTDTEIKRDQARCLTSSVLSDPVTRQGKLRVAYAMVERPVSNSAKLAAARYLVLTDDAGTFICVDGAFQAWSDHGQSDHVVINKQAAAWQDPTGTGSSQFCHTRGSAKIETDVLLRVAPHRVASAKVTISSGGKQLVPPTTVAVHGQWVYLPIAVVGTAAWKPITISVAAVDPGGKTVTIQPHAPGRSMTVTSLKLPVEHCR